MIIVIVEFDIAAENQAEALKVFGQDEQAARAMPGCEGFSINRVNGSKTALMLLEEWSDMAAFEAYKASEGFLRVGKALGPIMLGTPRSRTFEASLVVAKLPD